MPSRGRVGRDGGSCAVAASVHVGPRAPISAPSSKLEPSWGASDPPSSTHWRLTLQSSYSDRRPNLCAMLIWKHRLVIATGAVIILSLMGSQIVWARSGVPFAEKRFQDQCIETFFLFQSLGGSQIPDEDILRRDFSKLWISMLQSS